MPKPISIQLHTVRDLTKTPEGHRQTLEQIAAIGYAAIEGGVPAHTTPEAYKKFLDGLGLKISAAWAQPKKEDVGRLVDQAALFGYDTYVGCWGPNQVKDLAETKKTAAAFEEMAQLLAPHGLSMAYHNHWWEFVPLEDGRYPWDVLMDEAPTLKAQIDIYWASNFGQVDVAALVKKYAARTPILHAKDGPLVKDQPNTAVGSGRMDNTAPIRSADPAVLQSVVVELDKSGRDVMDDVRDSYDYLTRNGLAEGRK